MCENKIDKNVFNSNWMTQNVGRVIQNSNLMELIIKLTNVSAILNNEETRYLFLVSLISADTIVNVETAKQSIEELLFLKTNIQYIDVSEAIRKEVLKYVNKGLRIAKRDLKEYENSINNQS